MEGRQQVGGRQQDEPLLTWALLVNQGGNLGVGVHVDEARRELGALSDIDPPCIVLQAHGIGQLLQYNANLHSNCGVANVSKGVAVAG